MPFATVYLLFLLKHGDDRTSHLQPKVKAEFVVPSDIFYYSNVRRYNKAKYRMYSSELRMEFYLELMKLFCRAGENFPNIHCGTKCLLTANVCLF